MVNKKLLEHLGDVYIHRYMMPVWHGKQLSDAKVALQIFLQSYAFERQGRSPNYAPAAVDSLRFSSAIEPQAIWDTFSKSLGNTALNKANCPLFHEGSNCKCVVDVLSGSLNIENVIELAKQNLCSDQIVDAHRHLMKIRGIGSKIASFFLRDVALWYSLAPSVRRDLLQPVDVRIRRYVELVKSGANPAKFIVDEFDNPEKANAGIWYFSSQIVESEFNLKKALSDPEFSKSKVEEHFLSLKRTIDAWNL